MGIAIHGIGLSGGIAIGRALLMSQATLEVSHLTIPARMIAAEQQRFDSALQSVRGELAEIKQSTHNAPSELSALIDLHAMFLDDPYLVEVPRNMIAERRCNAEWALVQQMDALIEQFDCLEDAYLRERRFDVVQVVERVVKELSGHSANPLSRMKRGVKKEDLIIVAHDLSPAEVIGFKERHFAAFVTDVGSATSHTAILARGLDIPAIVGLENARSLIRDEELIIVDGQRGVVLIDPDPRTVEEFELRKEQLELEESRLLRLKGTFTKSMDDVKVQLWSNIDLPGDVDIALAHGAEGIGLFRSEFLFLGRGDTPDEEEQYTAYRQAVIGMRGRPTTIRTFDLGADKSDDTSRLPTNPSLGRRAIRQSLADPRMFQCQLRAILRASQHGPVKILIPMLSHQHEIEAVLQAIQQAKESLRLAKLRFDPAVEVGGMVEIPAAALSIGIFLKRMDFLSIGTNDLIQYTLAIDRMDEQVAGLYDPLHPAVLMLLAHIMSTAQKAGVPVSLCGEMAGDPSLTWLLLGMGLRIFSVHPAQILRVKERILRADIEAITPRVRRMLRLEESSRLQEALGRLNATRID